MERIDMFFSDMQKKMMGFQRLQLKVNVSLRSPRN